MKKQLDLILIDLANAIEVNAVKVIDKEKIVAWGRLRRAVKTKYYADRLSIDVFVDDSIAPYAQYVHEGRKPGKLPPVSMIEEWARKKRLLSSSAKGVKLSARINPLAKLSPKQKQLADRYHALAWGIAMNMKKKELTPRRFLITAIIQSLTDAR